MKKPGLLVIPAMAVSFLMSCAKANAITITWKNYDGTVLEIDENVPIGTVPSYDGATPTKPKDIQYSYTFSGWDHEITEAKTDQTYTAQYSQEAIEYTITFNGESGDITKTISADSLAITSPDHSTTERYENGHWEDESGIQIGSQQEFTFTTDQLANRTFNWVETAIKYTVTFKDKDGDYDTRIITVEDLVIEKAPEHPTTAHYESGRWEENGTQIQSGGEHTFELSELKEHTFTWAETAHGYTITFKDKSSTVDSKTISAENLSIADSPTHATTEHYENGRWVDEDGDVIVPGAGHTFELDKLGDHTFTWTEDPIKYTINFVDAKGNYDTRTISADSLTINAPLHSDTKYYENGHWKENEIEVGPGADHTFNLGELTEHTFTWVETPIEYKITFKDDKGEVATKFINITNLSITDCPTHSVTVHKDGCWQDENGLQILSGQATYSFTYDQLDTHTFTWTETIHDYKVKFVSAEETIETTINLSDLTIEAPEHSTSAHYKNGHWEDESGIQIASAGELTLVDQSELADYTFNWIETAIQYTITFVDDTGEIGTRFVNADSLTITSAPTHSVTQHYDGFWKGDDIVIESGEEYTFELSDLANHTLIWTETLHHYNINFCDKTGLLEQTTITLGGSYIQYFPGHELAKYYEGGYWEDEFGIIVYPGYEHWFTGSEITDHTFTWIETAIQYTVTFKFIDGSQETQNISAENLQFTTPKAKATSPHNIVWKTNGHTLNPEETKTLVASQLKDYTYTETIATPYTITYYLDGGTDPGNPTEYDITDKVTLKEPTQDKFVFSDWYLDEAKTQKFSGNWEPTSRTGNLVLYADWHSSTDLQKYDWGDISQICYGYRRPDKWFDIGQRRTVKMNLRGEEDFLYYTVRIIGFNHDDKADGSGKTGITFEFTNCYWETQWDTNNCCNYPSSAIKAAADTAFNDIHFSVSDKIKTVNKKVAVSSKTREWSVTTISAQLFPLSCIELGDWDRTTPSKMEEEGTTYEYYSPSLDFYERCRRRVRDRCYWTRSPYSTTEFYGDGSRALYVTTNGQSSPMLHEPTIVEGFCPAFCI